MESKYLKDWTFDQCKEVEDFVLDYFMMRGAETREGKKNFSNKDQIVNTLGLCFVSSGSSMAGLWLCNTEVFYKGTSLRYQGFIMDKEGNIFALLESQDNKNVEVDLHSKYYRLQKLVYNSFDRVISLYDVLEGEYLNRYGRKELISYEDKISFLKGIASVISKTRTQKYFLCLSELSSNCGLYKRLTFDGDRFEYVAGQDYIGEIRTIQYKVRNNK